MVGLCYLVRLHCKFFTRVWTFQVPSTPPYGKHLVVRYFFLSFLTNCIDSYRYTHSLHRRRSIRLWGTLKHGTILT